MFRLRLIPEEDLGTQRRTEVKLGFAAKTVMWIHCCLTPRVSGFNICLSICSSTSVCPGLPCLIWIQGLHLKIHWAPLKNSPEVCWWLLQIPEERQRPCWSYPRRSSIHKGFLRTAALSWGNQVLPLSCFCAWGWSESDLQPRSEEQLSVMVAGDWRGTKDYSCQRYSCHKELGNF